MAKDKTPKVTPEPAPGDNAKYLSTSLQLVALPRVDLRDPEAVQCRMADYFAIQAAADAKPTVMGMAIALGISRQELWSIKTGKSYTIGGLKNLPQGTIDVVQKGYAILENLWENYMLNGKINPVSGIFLGVNNFGYQNTNKAERVLIAQPPREETYSLDEIQQRYITDNSAPKQLPENNGD